MAKTPDEPAATQTIRQMSAEQPVERAATLEDVRAEVLAPERVIRG